MPKISAVLAASALALALSVPAFAADSGSTASSGSSPSSSSADLSNSDPSSSRRASAVEGQSDGNSTDKHGQSAQMPNPSAGAASTDEGSMRDRNQGSPIDNSGSGKTSAGTTGSSTN